MLPRSRRTIIAILATVALLLGPTTAAAQESPPEEGEIGNGTAKGTALVARVGPGVGDLELAIRAGLAVTQLTNLVAQSTGQTLDLGLIGTSLTAEGCRDDPIITADQLPQSTDVDNRSGDTRVTEDEGGASGAPLSVGHKDVEAGTDPVSSRATTTFARLDLPGVLQVNGGQAESITEVLPGEGRQATATSELSLSLGPITLTGLTWRAFHRTGVDPHAEASFSIGSIGGLPIDIPTDNLQVVEDAINAFSELVGLGLTIEFPKVERFLEPADLVRISPLRISIEDSELGANLIAPFKVASQDGQDALFNALTEAVCEAASVLLVGDVALSVLAGSGFLSVEIGGAEATSSRFNVENPFGDPVAPTLPLSPDPPPETTPPATAAPATPPPSSATTAPPTSETAAPATEASASIGPLESFCSSIHPNGNSCKEGTALALGLLGVLLTIAVAGYEVRKQWPRADDGPGDGA